jgi:hypothetical protein
LALHQLKEGDSGKAKDFLGELTPMAAQRSSFTWMAEQAFKWAESDRIDVRNGSMTWSIIENPTLR